MEWDRDGWTFHAKGLWIDFLNSKRIGTVIGSSNYGYFLISFRSLGLFLVMFWVVVFHKIFR